MAQVYHPSFLNNCKSFLNVPVDRDVDSNYLNVGAEHWNEHYFQILIFEDPQAQDPKPTLVYGKKKDLQDYYFKCNPEEFSAPTEGVKVRPDFVNKEEPEFPTIRFLLQSRKLSQLLTYTWIKQSDSEIEESKKLKIKLAKRILDSYNISPYRTIFIKRESESNFTETEILDYINLKEKLLAIDKESQKYPEDLGSFLIKLESRSYNSIQLALLSSGNAYCRECNKITRIAEPIFSNYEIVWENAFEISWDSFYSSQEDVSESGQNPQPPYHTLIIGYPPRPSKFTVNQKTLKDWAMSGESEEDCKVQKYTNYPFYPKKYNRNGEETAEWKNKKLDYIVPPHPYIPVTCG